MTDNCSPKLDSKDNIERSCKDDDRGTHFDEAIALCGYGKFHIYLFAACVFGQIAQVTTTSLTSFLLSNAECDLNMSLSDKGLLNAITYAGMISSSILTGFLSDVIGRKFFLVWGYFAMALCTLVQATSQTLMVLLVLKYIDGFVFAGPFSAVVSYMGEMHDDKNRSRVLMYAFCFLGVANIIIPLIGWLILPHDWMIVLIEDTFIFRSWHLFLAINSVWGFVASLMFAFLPESPKFELAHSKHNQALTTLKNMYSLNTGKTADSFPAKKIYLNNTYEKTTSFKESLRSGLKNMSPLLGKPHITTLLLTCTIQFGVMLSLNTFRLWYPQLSTIFENYFVEHNETAAVCVMLNDYTKKKSKAVLVTNITECIPVRSGSETYINSAFLGVASILPYILAGYLINKLGKKRLIFIMMAACGILAATLFLSINSVMIVAYFSAFVPMSQITVGLMLTVTVDAFPTAFRAITLAILMTIGRIGTLLGNMFFPHMLEIGCLVPFITIATLCFLAAFLGWFLPINKNG